MTDQVFRAPVPEPPPSIPRALDEFTQYLTRERGLEPTTTITNYRYEIRRFLEERFGDGPLRPSELTATDVTRHVLHVADRSRGGSVKVTVTALRCYLRYLRLCDEITTDLAAAVPAARCSPANLPGALTPEQVQRLLASCDRSGAAGQRDYAVLLVLTRLGLRAREVVAMKLEDFAWREGVVTVRGKGARRDRLPIPPDVGDALADYLRYGRPESSNQHVFLGLRAPYRELTSIRRIVGRALLRADLDPPRKGAHLLRHTLATEMLAQGASLAEIGQILRHRSPSVTEIYARVDLSALRELAQPWPGGAL